MKGFKPWRSCNSACIATHQDYDDDDDEDDDDEEEEQEDEIKLVLNCVQALILKTCESKGCTFFSLPIIGQMLAMSGGRWVILEL